ncbi:hypothetical protein QNK12_09980 [Neobacillus cucumis]|nr:hypothetical protein QNK12_09980 [Neobacillus cucumis]
MNDARQARTQRLVSFGVLANRISSYKYGIPKSVVRELVDYRLSLTAMQADELLRPIAKNDLVILELLIEYARELNSGNTTKAKAIMKEAIAKWDANDRLMIEVTKQ